MLSILTSVIGFVSIPKPRLEADYIIVGAGGAGCPLAARMAVAGLDVLLLEEGPNDDGTHFSLLFQANIDPYDASSSTTSKAPLESRMSKRRQAPNRRDSACIDGEKRQPL
eukprot:6181001-Pleurochrysis_carterae.AAC.3